jgi:hypothetical protein
MAHHEIFTPAELRTYRSFRRPIDIQHFLDRRITYNKEPNGETCYSPRLMLRHRVGHCLEGAMFAGVALEFLGHPARMIDLTAARDYDHVIAVFQQGGRWGAISKSNYSGLGYREPVYLTLRELAMSYFEHFFNRRRERTLRGYSHPVSLSRFDSLQWRTAERSVWEVSDYLFEIKHFNLIPRRISLTTVSPKTFEAGLVGSVTT